jgi:DNA polymerase-3 subunit alpha
MYGAVHFYKACKSAGVKPVIGCEVYLAQKSRFDKQGRADADPWHLTILAETQEGYRNLVKLVSASHIEGFYYRPRVDLELLSRHSKGLIALSGCLQSKITSMLLQDQREMARQAAGELLDIFGRDCFFIELQDHGLPDQGKANPMLTDLARELSASLVATNDVHYLRREDADMHDVLLCVQTGATIDQEKRLRFHGDQFYLKSPEEMGQLFEDVPEAIEATARIADRCDVRLDFHGFLLPSFETPPGTESSEAYLRRLCFEALPLRYSDGQEQARERLEYELRVICQKGLADYILIVADLVRFARERGILYGIRGSAAGSVVLYLLGLTRLDPISLGLPFERFISPDRGDMPDIDCDFEDTHRDEVLRHLVERYGEGHVAQIVTFNTMKARAAIRDVGRVLHVPLAQIDRVAKLISPAHSLEEELEANVELQHEQMGDETMTRVLDLAKEIEGLPRHASTHAGGVVIGSVPLVELLPLQRPTGEAVAMTTQYDMDAVKEVGLVKMDFLGLRTLSVIKSALELVRKNHGVEIDLDALDYSDPKTYELLSRGDTVGVFQLESAGMRATLQELRPDRFEDITAVVALYRPGPMADISSYIAGKHGRRQIAYLHPKLKPILKDTYGIIVYQEQVLQIATDLAGFTITQADNLRSAMKNKDEALMAKLKVDFLRGCLNNGVSEQTGEQIFSRMRDFARYGFNKAHSACYAVIAYITVYLKAYWPVEFMAAVLTSFIEHKEQLAAHVQECRRMGLRLLPPDVNYSGEHFTVEPVLRSAAKDESVLRSATKHEGGAIRFGLAAIKHVSRPAIHAIMREREERGPFRDFFDFCSRLDPSVVNRTVLESLARAGAFAGLGSHRNQVLQSLDTALEFSQRAHEDKRSGQVSLFGEGAAAAAGPRPALPDVPELPRDEILAMEKDYLGLFISDHPLNPYADQLDPLVTARASELLERENREDVIIGGMVTALRRHTARNGRPMMFITLEDRTGSVEVTVFPDLYERRGSGISKDSVVLVRGRAEAPYRAEEGEPRAVAKVVASDVALLSDQQAVDALRSARPSARPGARRGRGSAAPETQQANARSQRNPPQMVADAPELQRRSVADAPPAPVPRPAPAVHIQVPGDKTGPEDLSQLRNIISTFSGPSQVFLHLETDLGEKLLSLGATFKVENGPYLRRAVEDFLGEGSMWEEG